jgi:hypothetical protein
MNGLVGTFHFAIEPWRSWFDIAVPYTQLLDVSMELGLELLTIVCSNCLNTEGILLFHVINKRDRCGLVVPMVDL